LKRLRKGGKRAEKANNTIKIRKNQLIAKGKRPEWMVCPTQFLGPD
jgi:hypothetical protein